MNLEPYVYTWAVKTPQKSEFLILPDTTEDDPGLVHFSQLKPDGTSFNWLWLFEHPYNAAAIRMLSKQIQGDIWPIIEATLHQPGAYIQRIPTDWIRSVDLEALDIQQVWLNFDRERFYKDLNLNTMVVTKMDAVDFAKKR